MSTTVGVSCPICLSADGYTCSARQFDNRDAKIFVCEVCGTFAVARSALDDCPQLKVPGMTFVKRAALSHQIRLGSSRAGEPRMLTTFDLEALIEGGLKLPTPGQQAVNAIRYIGDRIAIEGAPIDCLPPEFSAVIGSPSREFACSLVVELSVHGLAKGMINSDVNGPAHLQDLSLTLMGWDRYESERRGQRSGNYGFIALKFGDIILDPLVRDHIKPALASIGFDTVDLRDVSKAGIIDNLLRVRTH